jgi:hypothetical protein
MTGSYSSSFMAFVVALVLAALLSLVVRPPRKRLARIIRDEATTEVQPFRSKGNGPVPR